MVFEKLVVNSSPPLPTLYFLWLWIIFVISQPIEEYLLGHVFAILVMYNEVKSIK